MTPRTILLAVLVVAALFGVAALGLQWQQPQPAGLAAPDLRGPALAEVPPLPALTRTSVVVVPIEVTLAAIRDAMEREAPRDFSGRQDKPISKLISKSEIAWTATRGPLAVTANRQALAIAAEVSGTLHASGQLSARSAGELGNAISGLLGPQAGRGIERLASRSFDQRADIRGALLVTARPAITPAWRIEPNLAAQVSLADGSLVIAGMRLNLAHEVKPLLERAVNEQVAKIEAKLRDDAFLEQAARNEWAKLCRTIPIRAAGMSGLWLEVRPTRAVLAQPQGDAAAVKLTVGIEAETHIVSAETKPECPFPATLEVVPALSEPGVRIAVPVDVPFTEVNRLMTARLAGKTLHEGGASFTVKSASVAPSGERLLLSLNLQADTAKSWIGRASTATVYVWGRPLLDREQQVIQLADVAVDVKSDAGFSLIGIAARAAEPLLRRLVADNATVDLRPYAANARASVQAAIAELRDAREGVRVDATVTDLRLTDIAFDAQTLRAVAEADGTASVTVTALPQR